MRSYLAVDIGASSGRHILGRLTDGRLTIKEVYRFPNGASRRDGHLCWDIGALEEHVFEGMRRCAALEGVPDSVGVDTWGVDFVLLDGGGRRLGEAVSYRDGRAAGMDAALSRIIAPDALYARTGIQKQPFNTLYQLMAVRRQSPGLLDQAERFLMIPDYLHYLLTGVAANEYTNASTTQLMRAGQAQWDRELIELAGLPARIFSTPRAPGGRLGRLSPRARERAGFDCEVVLPATHDTGSAVLAVPAGEKDFLYLSSGTWSLLGTERGSADASPEARDANFTNEGGYGGTIRFLKNIMGSWMIQSVRRENGGRYSFEDLCGMARASEDFPSLPDVNDPSFLAPDSMTGAVKAYCARTGQPVPQTLGEVMRCVYSGLARSYAETIRQIERITGKAYPALYIVGGGSQDSYLNRLTARAAGRPVFAGPVEATAVGNLLAQMLCAGEFSNAAQARACVRESFGARPVEA